MTILFLVVSQQISHYTLIFFISHHSTYVFLISFFFLHIINQMPFVFPRYFLAICKLYSDSSFCPSSKASSRTVFSSSNNYSQVWLCDTLRWVSCLIKQDITILKFGDPVQDWIFVFPLSRDNLNLFPELGASLNTYGHKDKLCSGNILKVKWLIRGRMNCMSICCCCLVGKLYPTLATPWTVAHQAPLSIGFPRPEY